MTILCLPRYWYASQDLSPLLPSMITDRYIPVRSEDDKREHFPEKGFEHWGSRTLKIRPDTQNCPKAVMRDLHLLLVRLSKNQEDKK